MDVEAIRVQHVWKIFGTRAAEAFGATERGHLSKSEVLERYDCVVAVADVNFSVGEGEIFCIMGLSGSGKSTVVRHINRLLEPTTGQIFIYGEDVMQKSPEELRRLRANHIGMVFQNIALLPHRTVRENVALPLEVQREPKLKRYQVAEESLATVGLTGWEDRYPHELSGGMQQRVGLARALAANPDILLMDEPFSALDPLIRRQLQDQFLDLARRVRKTTVFITHDLDEAIRLGDRIAMMRDGRIVQTGTPSEIVRNPREEYVADFVKGISRLKLVAAGEIMEPIDGHRDAFDLRLCPQANVMADLNTLVDLAAETDHPIVIVDDGREVGLVTKRQLFRGIQGRA